MVDIAKLKIDIINRLSGSQEQHLYYHNAEHTLYVLDKATHIAHKEKVSCEELHLIQIAALYHDVGYMIKRDGHEIKSVEIAQKKLKNQLSKKDISIITSMIMATKVPQEPISTLDKILADADLFYLSTNNFFEISHNLYKELLAFDSTLTPEKWDKKQILFFVNHKYHTSYCRRYRERYKHGNLQELMDKKF